MNANTLLMYASIFVIVVLLVVLYILARRKKEIYIEEDFNSIDKIVEAVKQEMVEIIKDDYTVGLSSSDFNALYKRKAKIKDALNKCVYGIDDAKIRVIELIRAFIAKKVPLEKVNELLGLVDGMRPSDHVMFEILMYKLKKTHGNKALGYLLEKYGYDKPRPATNAINDHEKAFYVTQEDLRYMYDCENIKLTNDEKIDVLAVLVYQLYKGFGILDTLREMDINGFNCGTSGSVLSTLKSYKEGSFKASRSVWVYYKGKYIHFRFMDFGSEEELKRVINLLIRYNNPGSLTAKRGYLVNTMYDKSRILALRPPASEYWAVFVRKFTISDPSPERLIIKEGVKNGHLPIKLIEFLMRGQITCAVTGRQGSGKTTLMSSIIRYIDPRFTIRILEMAPELYLREIYPTRNILSVQETNTVSATELQDALKKSDAAVSIVGEVATDEVAARMIQMGMTASLFTIFSHHANTAKKLVLTLRNSLVNAGGFSNMETAERQVLEVVKVDIHLDYTPNGDRFIERITEIIPLEEGVPYPKFDRDDPYGSLGNLLHEYFTRKTDRVSFITRDILRYDKKEKRYYVVGRLSKELESFLRGNLEDEYRVEFDKFIYKEFGKRTDLEEGEVDEVVEGLISYYTKNEIPKKAINRIENEVGISLVEDEKLPTNIGESEKEKVVSTLVDETYDLSSFYNRIEDMLSEVERKVKDDKLNALKSDALESSEEGLIVEDGVEVTEDEMVQQQEQEVEDMMFFLEFFDGEVEL